jgi:hypothetical protein
MMRRHSGLITYDAVKNILNVIRLELNGSFIAAYHLLSLFAESASSEAPQEWARVTPKDLEQVLAFLTRSSMVKHSAMAAAEAFFMANPSWATPARIRPVLVYAGNSFDSTSSQALAVIAEIAEKGPEDENRLFFQGLAAAVKDRQNDHRRREWLAEQTETDEAYADLQTNLAGLWKNRRDSVERGGLPAETADKIFDDAFDRLIHAESSPAGSRLSQMCTRFTKWVRSLFPQKNNARIVRRGVRFPEKWKRHGPL